MADVRWHATVAHSANKGIGQPTRSSAVSVSGFLRLSLNLSDDHLLAPSLKNRDQSGCEVRLEVKCKN